MTLHLSNIDGRTSDSELLSIINVEGARLKRTMGLGYTALLTVNDAEAMAVMQRLDGLLVRGRRINCRVAHDQHRVTYHAR